MIGYGFHPEAVLDTEEIWDFIAVDSIDSADKVVAELLAEVGEVVSFPGRGHRRADRLHDLCGFLLCVSI